MFVDALRWVHSDCSVLGEPPEAKCVCLLCKEQQPLAEIQTREASEETEGQAALVEMTIQTDAVTEEHTDRSEGTPGPRGSADTAQADTETPMDLGKCESNTVSKKQLLVKLRLHDMRETHDNAFKYHNRDITCRI